MNKTHQFYQDSLKPRNLGFCDYTYLDGDYCSIAKKDHDMNIEQQYLIGCTCNCHRTEQAHIRHYGCE